MEKQNRSGSGDDKTTEKKPPEKGQDSVPSVPETEEVPKPKPSTSPQEKGTDETIGVP